MDVGGGATECACSHRSAVLASSGPNDFPLAQVAQVGHGHAGTGPFELDSDTVKLGGILPRTLHSGASTDRPE